MVNMKQNLSIIILNINLKNTPIKRLRLSDLVFDKSN